MRRLLLLRSVAMLLAGLTVSVAVSPVGASSREMEAGTLVLGGADWLDGAGVDIFSNGAVVGNTHGWNSASTPEGTVVDSGFKWQCVEMVNRLYIEQGWIGERWSGDGKKMYGNAPSHLAKSAQGSIASVSPGDVLAWDGGTWGHVGIVDAVTDNGNGTSTVVSVNQNMPNARYSHTWDHEDMEIAGGFSSMSVMGVIHAPSNPSGSSSGFLSTPKTWNGVSNNAAYLGDRLERGEIMRKGEYIAPDNLRSVLYMQGDGNVVLAVEGKVVWETATNGTGADYLKFGGDGNLVIYDDKGTSSTSDDEAVWDPRDLASDSNPAETGDWLTADSTAALVIQNDGNVVAYNAIPPNQSHEGGAYWWHATTQVETEPINEGDGTLASGSELLAGRYIHNLDTTKPHALMLQADGNLVFYGPGYFVKEESRTNGSGAVRAVMQTDGNVVLRQANGNAVGHTRTYNHPGAILRIGGDGNLVVYDGSAPIWNRISNDFSVIPWP